MRRCLGENDEQIRPAVLEQALAVGEALLGIRSEICQRTDWSPSLFS